MITISKNEFYKIISNCSNCHFFEEGNPFLNFGKFGDKKFYFYSHEKTLMNDSIYIHFDWIWLILKLSNFVLLVNQELIFVDGLSDEYSQNIYIFDISNNFIRLFPTINFASYKDISNSVQVFDSYLKINCDKINRTINDKYHSFIDIQKEFTQINIQKMIELVQCNMNGLFVNKYKSLNIFYDAQFIFIK
jgi:hypothetical protein